MRAAQFTGYLNPWKLRRERRTETLTALRQRDGDSCRRCRRKLRFDLPDGHDRAPKIETGHRGSKQPMLDESYLCHHRCNSEGVDHTGEVQQRIRMKSEAALFSRSSQPTDVAAE